MKVGILGGTFDPVHLGHLNMAQEVLEKWNLDEIWFTPVRVSPHKTDDPPTSVQHRLEMLRLALKSNHFFKICEVETERKGPSYTIDTISELQENHPDTQFFLILSDEVLPNFTKWHKPDEIARKVPFIVASRYRKEMPELSVSEEVMEAVRKGWTPTSIMEISATNIRNRLKKNLYCGYQVPEKVLDYIQSNHLYY